jgi:hypothetical protein
MGPRPPASVAPLAGIHTSLVSFFKDNEEGRHKFEQCTVDLRMPEIPAIKSVSSAIGEIAKAERVQVLLAQVETIKKKMAGEVLSSSSLEKLIADLVDPNRRHNIDFVVHQEAFVIFSQAAEQVQPLRLVDDILQSDLKGETTFHKLLTLYYRDYFGSMTIKAQPVSSPGSERVDFSLESGGFIDRNGHSFSFPGWSLEITQSNGKKVSVAATSVDSKRLTSDLVRIFVEAFFDAAFYVPADSQATAVVDKLQLLKGTKDAYPAWTGLQFTDKKQALMNTEVSGGIAKAGTQAEAFVTAAMGKAVRGGVITSLNNETLAAGAETAAGVVAKKLVEREVYCYYKTKYDSSPVSASVAPRP